MNTTRRRKPGSHNAGILSTGTLGEGASAKRIHKGNEFLRAILGCHAVDANHGVSLKIKCTRKTTRRRSRRLLRRLSRRLTRGTPSHDYGQETVIAFRRFVKLHRRLMKLVPEVFDHGIEMHLRKRKEEEEQHMQLFLPLLEKVYGTGKDSKTAPSNSDTRCRNGAEKVQHPLGHLSPARRRKVDALYEERNMWLKVGSQAMDNMQQQPHYLPRFSLIADMIDVAFTMQRLMCGLETNLKIEPQEQMCYRNFMDDLIRIYGSDNGDIPPESAY